MQKYKKKKKNRKTQNSKALKNCILLLTENISGMCR